jgi:hypothetical protein
LPTLIQVWGPRMAELVGFLAENFG